MFNYIFWDFDGTLFDTYGIMANAFCETLKEDGIEESVDDIMRNMKVSISYAVDIYKKKYGINDEFLSRSNKRRKEDEIKHAKPFDEIENICRLITSNGCKNFLYTHRSQSALQLMKMNNIDIYFCDFITSELGFERKPNPNALNYFIEKYNINREKTIMIGDREELDIIAAVNAGIYSCLFTGNMEINSVADYKVNDYKQLYSILFD